MSKINLRAFVSFDAELLYDNVTCCINADLQEFYELTLLDENKTTQQKTLETLQIASRWELDPPIVATQQQAEVCQRFMFIRRKG